MWTITEIGSDPPLRSYSVLCGEGTDTTELIGTFEFTPAGEFISLIAVHSEGHVSQACLAARDRSCGESPFADCAPSNVLRTIDGCEVEDSYYCVQGDELWMRGTDLEQEALIRATR